MMTVRTPLNQWVCTVLSLILVGVSLSVTVDDGSDDDDDDDEEDVDDEECLKKLREKVC